MCVRVCVRQWVEAPQTINSRKAMEGIRCRQSRLLLTRDSATGHFLHLWLSMFFVHGGLFSFLRLCRMCTTEGADGCDGEWWSAQVLRRVTWRPPERSGRDRVSLLMQSRAENTTQSVFVKTSARNHSYICNPNARLFHHEVVVEPSNKCSLNSLLSPTHVNANSSMLTCCC